MNSRSFWAVLVAACIAGTSGIFIKSMGISPISQAWLRMAFPASLMALLMLIDGTAFFRGRWKKMLMISGLGSIRIVLFFIAFSYTSIGNAVILFYTFPIFAAFFSFLIIKEKTSLFQRLLLAVAFGGILLSFSNKEFSFGNQDFLGMTAAIVSAIIYSLTVVLFKSESKNYKLKELVFYQNLVGAIILFPFFQFAEAQVRDYTLGLTYGLIIGVIGFGLFFYGLKQLKAVTASALMYMEVVSAVLFGVWFFNETLSTPMIIGGLLIVGCSYGLSLTR